MVALAPPAAWLVHMGVVYGAEELVCSSGLRGSEVLGLTPVEGVTGTVTVVTLAVALGGSMVGYRMWATSRRDTGVDPPAGPDAFLGLAGLLLGGLFAVVILLEATPAAFLDPCA